MKLLRIVFFVLGCLVCLPEISFGQDTARYKTQENFKREIIIKDKRFRVYNNWLSGGVGLGFNTGIPFLQTVIGVNMNFHIKRYYFRIGGMMTGDNFSLWNNYQLHLGYIPLRRETEKHNLAIVGGISYLTGYQYVGLDINHNHVYNNAHPYATVGGYAEIQYIRKIYYDTGIGGAFFVNVCDKNSIMGLRADLYLSGAYKGYVKGKEAP